MQQGEDRSYVYTIYTLSGKEQRVSEYMDYYLPKGIVTDKYIPMREMSIKVKGERKTRMDRLFPGYLFVETKDPTLLYQELKRVPGMTKLLSDGEKNFYKLPDKEVLYINQIGGLRGDHIFGLSQVEIDETRPDLKLGDRVRVVSGDLMDFLGDITRFDLHHRMAYIWTNLFGGSEVGVGIEFLVK